MDLHTFLNLFCTLIFFTMHEIRVSDAEGVADVFKKECIGSSTKISTGGDSKTRYENYRQMYENCTHVKSNIEIVYLQLTGEQYDLSFLENIREVSGYVLIFGNFVKRIRLTNLRVIRGHNKFNMIEDDGRKGSFSLYVAHNSHRENDSIGLEEIEMPSLVEILTGSVLFKANRRLCFGENTIDWKRIIYDKNAGFSSPDSSGFPKIDCKSFGSCNERCQEHSGRRYCWGSAEDLCQKIPKCNSASCPKRCTEDGRCCHEDCIAGCTGTSKGDCLSCKKYARYRENEEKFECVSKCTGGQDLDHAGNWQPLEDNTVLGTRCIYKSDCPNTMVLQEENEEFFCAPSCAKGFMPNETTRECIKCPDKCPTACFGNTDWLNKNDVDGFRGCNRVLGNLIIDNATFDGHVNFPRIWFEDLDALREIQEVTGYVVIRAWHVNFTTLSFLQNLTTIYGNKYGALSAGFALLVHDSSLQSLGLKSLRTIKMGTARFRDNPHLCYVNDLSLSTVLEDKSKEMKVMRNRDPSQCVQEGKVCSSLCSDSGCWGPGDDMCITCREFLFDGNCVTNCSFLGSDYHNATDGLRGSVECRRCDKECDGGCSGDGPRNCFRCKNVKHFDECRSECPDDFYSDASICQPCPAECKNCKGNSTTLGEYGCTECRLIHVRHDSFLSSITCELSNLTECYEDYWRGTVVDQHGNPKMQCNRCNPECVGCTADGAHRCLACRNYNQTDADGDFKCVANCSTMHQQVGDNHCAFLPRSEGSVGQLSRNAAIPIFTILAIVIIAVIIIFALYWRHQKLRKRRLEILAQELIQIPLIGAGKAKPNMATLMLIKESELRKGNVIGSGAFGTVYKGIWLPEKESVKIPVAIKVLHETANSNLNTELLDEARIMASVCHPNCVRILAVCMTAQMMLVTQLMPLGCLLEYIRKERSNIGSRSLLLWSVQIAKGMKHLEELGIVHRDLAARNVLVQSSNQVKITDFGLAKLLECDEEEIHSEGGKMPIKWLALECIQNRIYTHKTDVWSYGVTLWEMFTYGGRPYENLTARQVPPALEKGERLPQPNMCTIDVYMIMIKCWMLDADSRPTFTDLITEFTRMAQDPGRFLVIQGDKLMRLPSHVPDAKDLVRLMSLPTDEPDLKVVDGEEYLRPKDLDYGEDSVPPTSSPLGPLTSIPEDVTYENTQPNRDSVDARWPPEKSPKVSHQDSIEPNQRYITDPCRYDGAYKDTATEPNQPLRVDEEGYLPPKSVMTAPNYLDLVYQPTNNNLEVPPATQNNQQYLDMSTNVGPSKDNPMYYENDETFLVNDGLKSNKMQDIDKPGVNQSEYCNVPSNSTRLAPYSRLPESNV